jgi:ferredoxin
MLIIHPEECIDCGACVDPCPVDAIFHEDELPEKWNEYIAINADFFEGKEGLEPARKD